MSVPRYRPSAVVGTVLLATLALGACSSSGASAGRDSGVSSAQSGPAAPPVGADAQSPEAAQSGQSAAKSGAASGSAGNGTAAKPGTSTAPADLVAADKLVRTASLTVQVDDVEAKAAEARRIAVSAGGSVLSENSTAVPRTNDGQVDKTGSRSSLSLAVPSDTLDGVLDNLSKLGTTAARTSSATDVTKTYVDTQSRIKTMQAGLDQLRTLVGKTTDLNQIVNLETEINRRQADLDSLQAQLNALDKKVAMSTVSLSLTTAAPVVVPDEPETGFLGGLKSGWREFLKFGAGVLTVVGAVLPFLITLAVILAPIVWWRRRRQTGPQSTPDYAQWGPRENGNGNGGTGGNGGPDNGGGGAPDPDSGAGDPDPSEREPEPVGAR